MKFLKKCSFVKTVFVGGFRTQLEQETTWVAATTLGLGQGLKYKGDIKTGLITGAATIVVLGTVNGFYNIATNYSKMKEIFKEE